MREIMLAAAKIRVHLFRNNVGNGYVGELVRKLPNGDVVLRHWRRIQFGLCPGSSDLIGWRSVTITPEMVGKTIAQFVAIETKTEDGRISKEQQDFLCVASEEGAVTCVARAVPDAVRRLTK